MARAMFRRRDDATDGPTLLSSIWELRYAAPHGDAIRIFGAGARRAARITAFDPTLKPMRSAFSR
jgi:hypothetical protein